ncbi:sensor histidine kinase [Nostocoides vanveenii]
MTRLPALSSLEGEDRDRAISHLARLALVGVWLIFLLEPLAAAWSARSGVRGQLGLAATVLFALLYMWHFERSRAFDASTDGLVGQRVTSRRWPRYAVLVALTVAVTLLIGQPGTATWVFLAVSGLWTMPMPYALAIGLALAGGYETLVRVLDGWNRHTGVSLSIVMAMLAVSAARLAMRRTADLSAARRENARLAVEEERHRLARDIHDILGHSLTVITVKAELAGRLLDVDAERARAEIASVEALAREALADVRGAVVGVREISLAGELASARQALTAAGITPRLPTAVDAVDPGLKELFAWTVRESVTNVVRHSGASTCRIDLEPKRIVVRDDGRGAHGGAQGSGLRGLRERARLVGASVTTSSAGENGFEVVVAGK